MAGSAGDRGDVGDSRYRVTGSIIDLGDSFDLRVQLYPWDEDTPENFRETMDWTPKLRKLAGKGVIGPGAGECRPGAEIGQRKIDRGRTLTDWVLLAEERLRDGDYRKLMLEAKKHLAEHCEWYRVAEIMDAAVLGLAEELGAAIERDPGSGLERLVRIEASAGTHLALVRLRARAHALLGRIRDEDRTYTEWLNAAPSDHPDRLAVLKAQDRVRGDIAIENAEIALGLDGRGRSLVRRGLLENGYAAGEGTGEFGDPFRILLESWQASNGYTATGFLTAEQANALIGVGRAAEERDMDDAAFGRAQAADTSIAYARYLANHPSGRHVAAARRLFAAASAREAKERAHAAAVAGERNLVLRREDRVLIEHGLASWRSGGGPVDGEFDDAFRDELSAWQASRGDPVTRYLTAAQSAALIEMGRNVEDRKKDDAAFGQAQAEDTAAGYEEYLSKYPKGRHAAEAKRLLAAIRAREDDAAFESAKKADTATAYEVYLSDYPGGRHADEARRLLEAARMRKAAAAGEKALKLTRNERALIERGLAATARGDKADGRFDEAFRAALRSWQESKGHTATGYLTREQANVLIAAGREDVERERDDAEYERAKEADTVKSYTAYMEDFPKGRHVAEAAQRREAARGREEAAAGEAALGLTRAQRVLVERGLASTKSGGGKVDGKFDKPFRDALRSWQAREGYAPTGYVTGGQVNVLVAEAKERERDDAGFRRAKEADTVESYTAYIEEFPGGRHVAQARERREAAREREHERDDTGFRRAKEADTVESYTAYIEEFPGGRHVAEARERREEARKRERDDAAFAKAQSQGTLEAYERYLKDFPKGRHVARAQALATELRVPPPPADEKSWPVGHRFRDCVHCPEMVVIPAGSFVRKGDGNTYEDVSKRMKIVEPPAVGIYEVTFEEWDACREAGACSHNPDDEGWGRGRRPVVDVNRQDVRQYLEWLSEVTGRTYRLLSESEWEYAARGGTRSKYHWGNGKKKNRANCAGCGSKWDGRRTAPVGSFPENPFGLHDVHGNAWEWTEDCWSRLSDASGLPRGPYDATPRSDRHGGSCDKRVVRGGAWSSKPEDMQSMKRKSFPLDQRRNDTGFRVARNLQ